MSAAASTGRSRTSAGAPNGSGVTGALPKSLHDRAKSDLHDIRMAKTRKEAEAAFDLFIETYGIKSERAVGKLVKDRGKLLSFYDFPAEHWKHIRTTNPVESVFSTVRNRTRKNGGYLSRRTALTMVFKLMMSAKRNRRKLSGSIRLPGIIEGIEFRNGIKQIQVPA